MAYQTLLYEKRDGVGYVKINRPDKLNALNHQVLQELLDCFQTLQGDEQVRVVILIGSGEKAFAAGADISELAPQNPVEGKETSLFGQQVFNLIENLGKPVIAAINGPCNGGGLELALCCDFRIASEEANLGLGEVKLGVMPLAGGTVRLPRLIGPSRAKEFMYFGNRVNGKQAYQIGLVNKVVPAAELMAEARKWALELSERAPLSLKMIKTSVNQGQDMSLMDALCYEARCGSELILSSDFKEGILAFTEKRRPVFMG